MDADATSRHRASQFGAGVGRTLRRKEWRLLTRDPNLFSQLSLQIIYTVPLAVVLVRGLENIPLAAALAPAVVVIAAQIAASLTWIAVSGEDAPELIAAAPVGRAEVELAKITSIAVPVLVILALPFAGLLYLSPHVGMLVLLFSAGASASTALLNLWHPMPGNRRGMLRRHSQSKLMALLEHLMAMLWAIAIVFAVIGTRLGRPADRAGDAAAPLLQSEPAALAPGNLAATFRTPSCAHGRSLTFVVIPTSRAPGAPARAAGWRA